MRGKQRTKKRTCTFNYLLQSHIGELHCNRFVSGIRGQCIKYKDKWMTPQEFDMNCGGSGKKYLENIQTDYGPLKTLTASGMLKPLSRKYRQQDGEDPGKVGGKRKKSKDGDDDDKEENHEDEDVEDYKDGANEKSGGEDVDKEGEHALKGSSKRKKKKYRDDWKRELLKNELNNGGSSNNAFAQPVAPPVNNIGNNEEEEDEDDDDEDEEEEEEMGGGQTQIYTSSGILTTPTFAAPQTSISIVGDQPPKISPSPLIHIPQTIDQAQTVYVMSPHPGHMSTPATPQHNPFAMSPSPALSIQSQPTTSNVKPIAPSTQSSGTGGSTSGSLARIGNILNIRCKSTTAQLYANKYESGSKGKCIHLGDEWLTPNEFEERAGSKAKKYLSSIKCMGRPLRVYVNSGELRGSGPPPPPKGSKLNAKLPNKLPVSSTVGTTTNSTVIAPATLTHQQPIAPAPAIQAPPTPSHISSAPAIPHNLNMVMGPAQPPILINQTSMASSMNRCPLYSRILLT